jgi:stearoyl-CoA desaturase (delta-9 desaturase)
MEKLFLFLVVISGLGSPFSYAAVHITHHIHSDTDKDPHGPKAGIKSMLFLFHRYGFVEETIKDNKYCNLLYEKYKFIQEYYLLLLGSFAICLYLINFNLFLYGWLIPVSLLQWGVAVGVYLQHIGGKINNFYYSLFGLGDELHRHHHADPKLINHALNKYQIDFTYQISRLFSR